MYIHRSNRTEALVDALAEVVARPLAAPTARECIAVQGRGMERWLSMELCRRFGVWANPDFPFPRHLLERAIAAAVGEEEAPADPFQPETLMWSIADLLPAYLHRPEFLPIQTYLAHDERGTKLVQLCQRIADTVDHYVVYRPQMVLRWEDGEGNDWQPVLWRALVERHGSHHFAARARDFFAATRARRVHSAHLPARVSLFGVSTLPPLYLEILVALSRLVEVHLFLLSPSREYWADLRSRREIIRALSQRGADAAESEEALHLAEGNPLLASLGRIGRDFQQLLEAGADYEEGARDLYCDPGTATMLSTLQSDILNLVHRGQPGEQPCIAALPDDRSIGIHACHGPMREIEVLHDQLRALFDDDDTLEPHDVVVMTPAIDAYAPFVDAVFGAGSGDRPRIPYRIADRGVRATCDLVDALVRLLAVLRGRLTAPEVLDLLDIDVIRARFGIEAADLELVRRWITEVGIRWGVDAEHRRAVGQPGLAQNTWRFGLDRLLLGYAMAGHGRTLYAGVLPYDDVEGTSTEVLGRLVDFCETLFDFREQLQHPRPLAAWRDDLGRLLERMLATTQRTAHQHRQIRAALAALAERAGAAGFDTEVDLDVVRTQVERELQRGASVYGFLSGGVTFCELVPMRSIPFRVVCLLGMNYDAFPRLRRPPGFDLIAQRPLPGDRSARDDDRYLFLEAVLSARARLLITYAGQSITDNSEIPPSVVVSELLDTIERSFRHGDEAAPASGEATPVPHAGAERRTPPRTAQVVGGPQTPRHGRVLLRHPLQPFSPRYFGEDDDGPLFSYAERYCDGARMLIRPRQPLPPFLSAPLGPPDRSVPAVEADDLVAFFEHPSRHLLQRRLGLYLGRDAAPVEEREPIVLTALDRWALGDALLRRTLEGEDLDDAFASARASGSLPPGVLGVCAYADVEPEVQQIAAAAQRWMSAARLDAVAVDGTIDGTRIVGVIREIWPAGQIRAQFSRLAGRSEIGLWIRHLLLNWAAPRGYPKRSILVGRPPLHDDVGAVSFREVAAPAVILRALLRLYWVGQQVPLPLFPRTSRAYVEALLRSRADRSETQALRAARRAFETRRFGSVPGEGDDPYVQQIYAACDPLHPGFRPAWLATSRPPTPASSAANEVAAPLSFRDVAQAVFVPLLEHREAEA